ncbi:MAG: homoserine dehydrogenase [Clostridium sp.]|nr:homoserine dehydrogenase [Clostridium sp.]
MDYTNLFKGSEGKTSRVGIIGATRGYGYTLLAQIPRVDRMELRLISARHTEECMEALRGLGYRDEDIALCKNKEEVQNAPAEAVLIVTDYRLALESDITALVECTGNTEVSADAAAGALRKGINVYMVSKETDSVCGPMLNQIAWENHAVYSLVNGDQPRNLLDLFSWGKVLGLEIIAAGKASEYDFVWDPDTGEFTYMEGEEKPHENIPALKEFWHYKDTETLKERRALVEKYMAVISADLCEMNLVSNVTGLVPSAPRLNYPVAKISELADIFIPEEDGGILKKTGVVDVFCNLRAPDEASFAGGEFIIVRCENETVWELLISKGHVVSRSGKYACIYLPYHYMGLETPLSILLGDLLGIGAHPECRQVTVMAGVAQEDLPQGTVLTVQGHHHSIEGLIPELWELKDAGNVAPFYLLNGTTLLRDVKKGEPVTRDAVSLSGTLPFELYSRGLELKDS